MAGAIGLLVILLVGATGILEFIVVQRQMKAQAGRDIDNQIQIYNTVLTAQLRHYDHMLKHMAALPQIQDLLLVEDLEAASAWALKHRPLIADGIGLALFTNDGQILGDPPALRVGEMCIRDLHETLTGANPLRHPVHTEVPALAHFDLIEPVKGPDGETIGALFASFSLAILQTSLERLVKPGEYVHILDSRGREIVAIDKIDGSDEALSASAEVAAMGWTLVLEKVPQSSLPFMVWLGSSSIILALLMGGLIVFISRRAIQRFLGELDNIRVGLHAIAGDQFSGEFPKARFEETQRIMPEIETIAKTLHEQNAALLNLSETDELTGLANRRRFKEELQRAWGLAGRGMTVCLVLIDLDGFKGLNDFAGHKAGDITLQELARCMQFRIRRTDVAARLGGDEFVVLLIDMEYKHVRSWFETLRQDFRNAQDEHVLLRKYAPCTLSAGLVQLSPERDESPEAGMERADKALYEAKESGRDRLQAAAL